MLFDRLSEPSVHLWEHLPAYSHESFAFTELAFSILSIAAGSYHFDPSNRFVGRSGGPESNGYLIDRSADAKPRLMPLFASGAHEYGKIPGCAPAAVTYWLQHVLIRLVSKSTLLRDTEAAIASAVEYGSEQNFGNFEVILFCITNAITVFVSIDGGIKTVSRNDVLSICDMQHLLCESRDVSELGILEQLKARHSGFGALQKWFHTATFAPSLNSGQVAAFPRALRQDI